MGKAGSGGSLEVKTLVLGISVRDLYPVGIWGLLVLVDDKDDDDGRV